MDSRWIDPVTGEAVESGNVDRFGAPPQGADPPGRIEAADPRVIALLERLAAPLRLADVARGTAPRGCVMVIARRLADRPDVLDFLASNPRLRARFLVDDDPSALHRAYDPGPFTIAMIAAAIASSDPLAALARAVPDGEEALMALASARAGIAFVALPPAARPSVDRPPHPRAVGALAAARFDLADGRAVTVVGLPFPPPHDRLADLSAAARAGEPIVVTTRRRLEAAFRAMIADDVLERAMLALPRIDPNLSARRAPTPLQAVLLVAGAVFIGVGALLDAVPGGLLAVSVFGALTFLLHGWLRLLAAIEYVDPASVPAPPAIREADLPTYTVIAAIYREEALAERLVERLAAFDYPPERREILVMVEEDDRRTRAAAERAAAGRHGVRVIAVPDGPPRTKPRALAYALAFARGDLVTVYDAEDRPEPDQLKRAAAALVGGPDHLACVQARLVIDRTEVALQRQFAIEYACLFDGLLPWLARGRLPLPLGGTSNHFKRIALEAVGGWDPWNVTEDADLAIRLARFGLTSATIDSATFEEAPARLGVWFRQRVRWIKGWLVCYLVAMRDPAALRREAGWRNLLAIQVLFGATVVAMLAHPIGLAVAALHLLGVRPLPAAGGFAGDLLAAALLLGTGCGYGANGFLAHRVLRHRRRPDLLASLWWMPVYWLLIAAAAWWAVVDLIRRPHHWAKTPHVEFEARAIRREERSGSGRQPKGPS